MNEKFLAGKRLKNKHSWRKNADRLEDELRSCKLTKTYLPDY